MAGFDRWQIFMLLNQQQHGKWLAGIDLSGVDLRGAKYNKDTEWPAGFDPKETRARFVSGEYK